jgi:hypothetical protein
MASSSATVAPWLAAFVAAARPGRRLSPRGHLCYEVLGGTKLGDLPIEQASKSIFAINLKTAKALAIVVPPTLLALAARHGWSPKDAKLRHGHGTTDAPR